MHKETDWKAHVDHLWEIHSIVQGFYWETSSRWTGLKISHILWNLKVHCHIKTTRHWTPSWAIWIQYTNTLKSHLFLQDPLSYYPTIYAYFFQKADKTVSREFKPVKKKEALNTLVPLSNIDGKRFNSFRNKLSFWCRSKKRTGHFGEKLWFLLSNKWFVANPVSCLMDMSLRRTA